MFIPDPDFYPSRISDPGSKNSYKREGWKKFVVIPFLLPQISQNFFIFELLKKKIWPKFQRILELFTQKVVTKLSKILAWDPGSGKNHFRIPDPGAKKTPDPESRGQIGTGSRIQGSKRHRIPDPDRQHWAWVWLIGSDIRLIGGYVFRFGTESVPADHSPVSICWHCRVRCRWI